jgi:hypothetical protein
LTPAAWSSMHAATRPPSRSTSRITLCRTMPCIGSSRGPRGERRRMISSRQFEGRAFITRRIATRSLELLVRLSEGIWKMAVPPGRSTRRNSEMYLRAKRGGTCCRTIRLNTRSKVESGNGRVFSAHAMNRTFACSLLRSRSACSTIDSETSSPVTESNLVASACVSRPTPQPKSSASPVRLSGWTISASERYFATSSSPMAKNRSRSQVPCSVPSQERTAQRGSLRPICSHSESREGGATLRTIPRTRSVLRAW